MGRLFQGNLQESLRTRNPVGKDLATFAPATLELALAAAALAGLLGVGLGLMLAGAGRIARALRLVLIPGAAVPTFLTAVLAILVFYPLLHPVPASGRVSDPLVLHTGPTKLLVGDAVVNLD